MTQAAIPRTSARPPAAGAVAQLRGWFTNPWGRPRFLPLIAWLYLAWSIVPVLIAIQFSFNTTRSTSVWHGFSTRWYWGDPVYSVWNNPELRGALAQSLKLAAADVAIATPIGVLLALGLARWRGRGSGASNFLMLFPLVTPEIVMGVSLPLLFTQLPPFAAIRTGTTAQILGHVTFSISYVVVIVRGRLFSIGREYEEAAADLGASPAVAILRVLMPLLAPAIVASAAIVFAISIDDFVISQWLSNGPNTTTVPIEIYSAARGQALPNTNAIATIMLLITLVTVVAGYAVYRFFTRAEGFGGRVATTVADFGI